MRTRHAVDRVRYARMTTAELREAFLVEDLFSPGELNLLHWEMERTIVGAAVPAARALALPAPPEIRADFFLQRRELGVVNVGAPGAVTVDGERHGLDRRDGLYVGRGAREVVFSSLVETDPARFWLVSHPAHAAFPTQRIRQADAQTVRIGDASHASARVLRRYVHLAGVPSAQLVMGVTDLESGSVWNTMPPHTHLRRTEIYLYVDLEPDAAVFHLMGPPEETRPLVVRNLQAILSPPWSVHFGAGTSRYAFVWSMGGENQEFEDMQAVSVDRIR